MDLEKIQDKLKNNQYLNSRELRNDFKLMFTNVKIFIACRKNEIRKSSKNITNVV
jgi:hypothetical protein